MNPQMTTPVTEETIARVKWYIDECLLLHFSKEETVTCLERNAGIDPELTRTLWDKEAVGKSLFFREYHNIRELISRLQDTSQFASRIHQRRLNPKLHKYHSDRKVFVANTIQQSTERPHAESSTSQQRAKRQHMDSAPPSMTQNVGHYGSRMGLMNPQFPATSSYGGPSVRPPHAQPLAPYGGPIQHPQVPVTTSSSYWGPLWPLHQVWPPQQVPVTTPSAPYGGPPIQHLQVPVTASTYGGPIQHSQVPVTTSSSYGGPLWPLHQVWPPQQVPVTAPSTPYGGPPIQHLQVPVTASTVSYGGPSVRPPQQAPAASWAPYGAP